MIGIVGEDMTQSTSGRISSVRRGTTSTVRRGGNARNHAEAHACGNLVTVCAGSCSLVASIFLVKEKAKPSAKTERLA